jgi:hypothetical protein
MTWKDSKSRLENGEENVGRHIPVAGGAGVSGVAIAATTSLHSDVTPIPLLI